MRTAFVVVAAALTLFISMPAAVSSESAAQAAVAPAPEWRPFSNLFGPDDCA